MTTIRAILIDPFACTVTEVQYDGGSLKQIYALLSHPTQPVDTITIAYGGHISRGDAIYVDDNGLMFAPLRFFQIAGAYQPFAGKGLVIGPSDEEGDTTGATTLLADIIAATSFYEHNGLGLVRTAMPWEAPPAG